MRINPMGKRIKLFAPPDNSGLSKIDATGVSRATAAVRSRHNQPVGQNMSKF
jgi:hypothetical protein